MTPVQSYCKRCERLFCYFAETNSRRQYCSTCVELERLDLLAFSKLQRRRKALAKAMEVGSIRPMARVAEGICA